MRTLLFGFLAVLIAGSYGARAQSSTIDDVTQSVARASAVQVGATEVSIGENNAAKKERRVSLFLPSDRSLIAEVTTSSEMISLRAKPGWEMVKFSEPTVPGWVSEAFVVIEDDVARVKVDILNLRLRPTTNSPILYRLPRGYSSRILSNKDGFVQILGPSQLEVLIKSQSQFGSKGQRIGEGGWLVSASAKGSDEEKSEPLISKAQVAANETQQRKAPLADQQADSSEAVVTEDQEPDGEPVAPLSIEKTHVVAPGDSISLLVFGEPDLSVENVRVPQSGRVSFPLIGSVTVSGKTTEEIENEVARLLAQGYVKNPRLSVSMFSYRPVFIRGEVESAGAFAYTEELTVAKALALAGGATASASRNGVSILRDGKTFAENLSIDSLAEVSSGDVLVVAKRQEAEEIESSFIYLHGEVSAPGEYAYRSGLTVEKAIVLAGGFTLRASKRKITVSRYEGVDKNGEPVKLKRVKLHTPIRPGDVIKVGASWF